MALAGKSESFIENVAGCGPFQVIIFLVVVCTNWIAVSYTLIIMSFANYNPGWRCLDNVTSLNTSDTTNMDGLQYTQGSCDVYNLCRDVEFNPETSTIVTEWGLLCDKAWMPSLTISIQMVGMFTGSIIGGQLTDTFGRKFTLYLSAALCGLTQLVSAFSVSWAMLTVLHFFTCGFSVSNLLIIMIYVSEVMTMKWRGIVITLPLWYVGAVVMSVTAMITKDWRQLLFVGSALQFICLIPVFWVPESIRWLEAKKKSKKFNIVTKKIAFWNKAVQLPMFDSDDEDLSKETKEIATDGKKYTIIDIFRHGYALISICLGLTTSVFSLIFYSTTFGTKALYGDFYTNLIVSNVTAIPVFLIAIFATNSMSRRLATYVFLMISAVCIFAATGLLFAPTEAARSIGSTVLISVARATLDFCWNFTYSRVTEIYPTVARGIGIGYVSLTARITGIMAPFIIPDDKDSLYIFTTISGALIIFCCFLNIWLPETKGKPLKETFDDRELELQIQVSDSS